ncbi:MAG: arginine--tRNA ligase [Patescibacteria group bacterium]
MKQLKNAIESAVKDLFGVDTDPELVRSDEQFGDFSCNIAMQIAVQIKKPPHEIASKLAQKINNKTFQVDVAGPGFLNITLGDDLLWQMAYNKPSQTLAGQTIVAEYSDPNPFKPLHAGHLYTTFVGDAIANLVEVAGAKVFCVNFGGDVGPHVARTIWAIIQELGGEKPDKLANITQPNADARAKKLGELYTSGNNAYEDNKTAKQEITELNKRIYQIHADNDHDSPLAQIYWQSRQWSYDYFDDFYKKINTHFDKYYPESLTAPIGLATVQEQLKNGIYEASDGAIVFRGEKYNLHTRVFINSDGLPTYEAKDVGLILSKWNDYHPDMSIIITANEITEYMKVVMKSIEQYAPDLVKGTRHITHGLVKLQGGVKMSSRKGNVLLANDIIEAADKEVSDKHNFQSESVKNDVTFGSIRYSFVKSRIGGDIIYDPKESVSLEGNSGPYLQYAHARARSILSKSDFQGRTLETMTVGDGERSLLRKIGEFSEVVDKAVVELKPHHICTYLYELAQIFNRFYEKNRVIGDKREVMRVLLVKSYVDVLENGLKILNIPTPEKL